MLEINENTFIENNMAFVDFYNHILGSDAYDYDNQKITYVHFQTLLNQHFPNNSLSYDFILNYFLNRDVLIGCCPISIDRVWCARALSHVKCCICNDLNDYESAKIKSVEYGFSVLNELLLLTK
jgi:hypothetical protein